MKRTNFCLSIVTTLYFGIVITGCKEQVSQAASQNSRAVSEAKSPPQPGNQKRVDRIVFIGQKQACDCTRNRIQASWKALEAANTKSPRVPVERIDWDVQEKEAEKYTDMKAMMVVPGIYFLDAQGTLIEMLQGEVTEDKIAKLLQQD